LDLAREHDVPSPAFKAAIERITSGIRMRPDTVSARQLLARGEGSGERRWKWERNTEQRKAAVPNRKQPMARRGIIPWTRRSLFEMTALQAMGHARPLSHRAICRATEPPRRSCTDYCGSEPASRAGVKRSRAARRASWSLRSKISRGGNSVKYSATRMPLLSS
jgi:hypothetical protein